MLLTVAICTWNRRALLQRTLESLCGLQLPAPHAWELLVVNNACTDDTDAVLAAFASRLPLRVVHEARPGVSWARNAAAQAARGDYIVWTDDDVLVPPDWLAAYAAAVDRHPDARFFGGPIEPLFEGTPPALVAAALRVAPYAYAALDHGAEEVPLTQHPTRWAFTANMAIPTALQRRFLFDGALGRRHGSMVGGEDTSMLRAIWDEGGEGRWVPEARVRHIIPAERQTVAFLRRYFRGLGQQVAVTSDTRAVPQLFGRPRWALRALLEHEVRGLGHRLLGHHEQWLAALRQAEHARGVMDQHRAAAHPAPATPPAHDAAEPMRR